MDKLYNFKKLKNRLRQLGYNVDGTSRYTVVKETFKNAISDGKIKASDKEILYKNHGKHYHVYVYLHDYSSISQNSFPKFHTTACNTITRFIHQGKFNEKYVVSNASTCSVRNVSTGEFILNTKLEICSNCEKQMAFSRKPIKTTIDFFNEYGKVDEVDRNGFPIEWKLYRGNYMKKRTFRCEHCGVDLREHRNMLEVYHKDEDKLNNEDDNLLLLCTDCACKYDKALEERLRKNLILQEKIKQIKGIRKNQGIKK